MNATVTQEAGSMGLIAAVLQSGHTPKLFGGKETHDPALRLVAQLVRHTSDDDLITHIVAAALPSDYGGNTLAELPGMVASARASGFDTSRDPTMAELVLRYVKNAGIVLFRDSRERGFMSVPQPSGAVLNFQLGTKSARAFLQQAWALPDGGRRMLHRQICKSPAAQRFTPGADKYLRNGDRTSHRQPCAQCCGGGLPQGENTVQQPSSNPPTGLRPARPAWGMR